MIRIIEKWQHNEYLFKCKPLKYISNNGYRVNYMSKKKFEIYLEILK